MSGTTPEQQAVAIMRSMGGLVFDAVFEETHQADLEVTDNPVETGVVVSDHAYLKPAQLSLKAGVSDAPLQGWIGAVDDSGAYRDLLRQDANDAFKSGNGRSVRAFQLLTELQAKAEPFDVQTGLKLYKNMVCTSIRTSQDKDTASVLMFEATLREVIIVNTQTVKYPPRKKGATHRQASKKKEAGEQQGKEVTADKGKKSSALIKGVDLVERGRERLREFFS